MRPPLLAAALLACSLAAACNGGSSGEKAKVATATTPAAPSAAALPRVAAKPTDPLTGLAAAVSGPVVAIKVDNAVLARPYQTGLGRAALVYQELVEGGSTRLLAVFESVLAGPGEVGPIRSVRESDVELVRQFGRIDVGFSGGNTGVKKIIRAAVRRGYLIDASFDAQPGGYRLGERRRDARNFYAVPSSLATRHPGSSVKDIGLRFGAPAAGGVPTTSAVAAYSTDSRVTVRYNPATKAWTVLQDGRVMPNVGPANVVLQRVVERRSGFHDVRGQPTPYTVTTGSGAVTVLRDGKRYVGRWQRTRTGPTRLLDAKGRDIPLKAGRTWVLMVPTTGHISFG